jgi:hypothetical protein
LPFGPFGISLPSKHSALDRASGFLFNQQRGLQPKREGLVSWVNHHFISDHGGWALFFVYFMRVPLPNGSLGYYSSFSFVHSTFKHVLSPGIPSNSKFQNRVFFAWICYGFTLWGEESINQDEVALQIDILLIFITLSSAVHFMLA